MIICSKHYTKPGLRVRFLSSAHSATTCFYRYRLHSFFPRWKWWSWSNTDLDVPGIPTWLFQTHFSYMSVCVSSCCTSGRVGPSKVWPAGVFHVCGLTLFVQHHVAVSRMFLWRDQTIWGSWASDCQRHLWSCHIWCPWQSQQLPPLNCTSSNPHVHPSPATQVQEHAVYNTIHFGVSYTWQWTSSVQYVLGSIKKIMSVTQCFPFWCFIPFFYYLLFSSYLEHCYWWLYK